MEYEEAGCSGFRFDAFLEGTMADGFSDTDEKVSRDPARSFQLAPLFSTMGLDCWIIRRVSRSGTGLRSDANCRLAISRVS